MSQKFTYQYLSEKYICLLLILSMLLVIDMEIAGFPIYSLMLFLITSAWMLSKAIYANREGKPFLRIKHPLDTAAIVVIFYAILEIAIKIFSSTEDSGFDFSWYAQMLALALLSLLLSTETQFKLPHLDLLLYSGLPVTGVYLFFCLAGEKSSGLAAVFSDSDVWASYFLLFSMTAVYPYCICRNRTRSLFYLLTAGVGFLALLLNQNIISLWLLGIYFIAIPVLFRARAVLIKRVMQLFFLYLFLLSSMSLIGEYTQIIQRKLSYTLEHSVYLDLLTAAGAVFFFHYWERIPEGIDLERLVLRKMQKGYRFLLKVICGLFLIIILAADSWTGVSEGIADDMLNSFALPLAEAVRRHDSAFLYCFQRMGAVPGIFLLVCVVLFFDRMGRNYHPDKTDTDILILISGIFLAQLLFWNPGIRNIVVFFYIMMMASFHKEERKEVISVGIKGDDSVRDSIGAG